MVAIKFRGKRLDNGEWVYGGVLVEKEYAAIIVYSDYHGWHEFIEVDPKTINQYAGTQNGLDVYVEALCGEGEQDES